MAAVAWVLSTAPDRLARHEVPHMLLVDARTQRGCRVECVERPMRDTPPDPLLVPSRSAVAESERPCMAERMRRGRHATRRRGQLLPWTRAPYGDLLDPERRRDPSGGRMDPVQAPVVAPMCAGDTEPGPPASLDEVAQRLSEAQRPALLRCSTCSPFVTLQVF